MSSSICVVADEATLVYDALHNVINETLGELEPAFALQDFTAKDAGSLSDVPVMSQILEALNTPPFLVPRRVVVVRDAQNLNADEASQLVAWIKQPAPDITLVVAVVGQKTNKIAKAAEELRAVGPGTGRDAKAIFVRDTFTNYGLEADAATLSLVGKHLGDDVARVDALARTLQNIYGTAPLLPKHVEPYLGEVGDVPAWDLTDAIDRGNVGQAIRVARRMLDSRGKAGLQIINMLQRDYLQAARVEGLQLDTDAAAVLLGAKPTPAGKALTRARALGVDRLGDALARIAQADGDLKGGVSYGGKDLESDQDPTELTVIEVLVARLARLNGSRRR